MHFRYASSFIGLITSAALAYPSSEPSILAKRHWIGDKAGAFFIEQYNTFNDIDATIVIPEFHWSEPETTISVWVGLDAFTCAASLKAGVYLNANDDGTHSYAGFSQFSPGPVNVFYDLSVSPGDTFELHVTADSPTSGSVLIRDIHNGTNSAYLQLDSNTPLCLGDAEWIVEALSSPMPYVDQVHFQSAVTQGPGGTFTPSDGANVLEVLQDNKTRTDTRVQGTDIYVVCV